MTIENCYEKFGGNYKEICGRIPSEKLIVKFIGAFLNDPSFNSLCEAMEQGDRDVAFRAAHTLKGVCANLSISSLQASSSELTEILRPAQTIPENAYPALDKVRADYQTVTDTIRAFLAEA